MPIRRILIEKFFLQELYIVKNKRKCAKTEHNKQKRGPNTRERKCAIMNPSKASGDGGDNGASPRTDPDATKYKTKKR